jgi:non-specific serine/threonine protein kinase
VLGEERFWLLETIREFAWERLEGSGELELVKARHARRMLSIATSASLADTGFVEGEQRHEVVRAELDDLRAALDWAVEGDVELGFELATALESHWVAAHPVEGIRRVEQLFEQVDAVSPALRAAGLRLRGGLAYLMGDYERGRLDYRESMAAFQALDDERGAANLLGRLVVDAGYFGDVGAARSLAHEALELSKKLGMPRLEAEALSALADTHRRENDAVGAWELMRRSADVAAACGFVWYQAHCLQCLTELGPVIGRLDDAERAAWEALRLARRMSERTLLLWTLTGLAVIEHARDDLGRAGRLFGAAAAEAVRDPPRQAEALATYAAPLEALTDPVFRAGREAGAAMELDEAVAFALGEDQTDP